MEQLPLGALCRFVDFLVIRLGFILGSVLALSTTMIPNFRVRSQYGFMKYGLDYSAESMVSGWEIEFYQVLLVCP